MKWYEKIWDWYEKKCEHDPNKTWKETWWGALWILGMAQLPGGIRRCQKWDKAFKKFEEKEKP